MFGISSKQINKSKYHTQLVLFKRIKNILLCGGIEYEYVK